MNRNTKVFAAIVGIIIVVGIVWYSRSASGSNGDLGSASTTSPVAVSETTKVSDKLLEYQNAELGFSIKYPSAWEKVETNTGISFIIPIDQNQVSSVVKLQADINAVSGKCAFPPVTTVKERNTVKVGNLNFNTISMSNTVQGREYFNRMYSLQQDSICYYFALATISQSPSSKGLTGSNITQAENNNRAIVNTTDTAFTNVVKSFSFVTAPKGQDESKVTPAAQ